jgi:hypothetical protein
MLGWVYLGCGVVVLLNTAWYEPRSMARVRSRVAEGGDPGKFDTWLDSRKYRLLRWLGVPAGIVLVVLGVSVLSGAA